jgi:hypothetical protein
MENVTLNLNDKGHGAFIIKEGEEELGEMVVGIAEMILLCTIPK